MAQRIGGTTLTGDMSRVRGLRELVASRPWLVALALVAFSYTAIQLVFTARIGLGWDESVYISQVARGVPPAEFSPPRARGVPILVAPVAMFTSSVTAIRVYLSLLSGAGLFLAYWPWLRLRSGPVVPLAAALFAGLWLSLFYANEAMPNMWVAYCGVAAVALFRLAEKHSRHALVLAGLVTAFGIASLVRPTDASWLALPLLAYGLARGRLAAVAAVAAGLAVGWTEWIAEAFLTYGGPLTRLKAAGAQNMTGLHFSLPDHLRALDGPMLCRFGIKCGGFPLEQIAWFAAIPILAALGVHVVGGVRGAPRRGFVLAVACALSLAVSYFFTVGYAAPRFLLPSYALLALPVAAGVVWLRGRRGTALFATAGLLCYFLVQGLSAFVYGRDTYLARRLDAITVSRLHAMGMRAPCFLYGHHAVQIAYLARCSAKGVITRYGGRAVPRSLEAAIARGDWVGVITPSARPPAPFLASWQPVDLRMGGRHHWHVFLPPPG
jgi:hypothetical protein